MAKRKSIYSVREATQIAFSEMIHEFSVIHLITRVRIVTNRPALTDGSILRRLRELRSDNELNYIVTDNEKSIYKKLKPLNLSA